MTSSNMPQNNEGPFLISVLTDGFVYLLLLGNPFLDNPLKNFKLAIQTERKVFHQKNGMLSVTLTVLRRNAPVIIIIYIVAFNRPDT